VRTAGQEFEKNQPKRENIASANEIVIVADFLLNPTPVFQA
jgi:hypothetical protein